MESFGKLLQNQRESRHYDLDFVSREISIDKRYLQALEEEDSSVFPGEAYLTGFLRNYASFLELDSEYLLKLYHNKQLQEAPLPEGLFVAPVRKTRWALIAVPIVLALAVAITCFLIFGHKKPVETDNNVVLSSNQKTKQYVLDEKKFNQRVYIGDQLIVPDEKEGNIVLTIRETLNSVGIETPAGLFFIELSEESEIDINGDSITDMIVYVSDISNTNKARGAELSILLRHGNVVGHSSVNEDDIPFASEISSKHPQRVLIEDTRAYPFTINASFRGSCLFRDRIDREPSVEAYFSRGEVFTATPHNGIRLWVSNSNTVKFTIIADAKTIDLDIGAPGEILVEDIKWIRDTDGKYKLVVIELD